MEANLAEYHAALGKAQTDLKRFERQTSTRLKGIQGQFRAFGSGVRNVMGVFGAGFALSGLVNFSKSIVKARDDIAAMSKRLETFSGDSRAFEKAEQAANLLGSSIDTVADGMTRILVSGKALGITSKQAQELTITFQQLGRVGGASAEESNRAFIQLTQGLGKGVLQGQDLKSVMSDVPLVAQAIAKELGVATGMLPKMAEQGKITGQVIKAALTNAADEASRAFAELPASLEQQQARISTAWKKALAGMDVALRSSATWKFFNEGITNFLNNIALKTSTDPLDAMQVDLNAINKALEKAAKFNLDVDAPLSRANLVGLTAGDAERVAGKSIKDLVAWRNEVIKLQAEYRSVFAAMERGEEVSSEVFSLTAEQLEKLQPVTVTATRILTDFNQMMKNTETDVQAAGRAFTVFKIELQQLFEQGLIDAEEFNNRLDEFLDKALPEEKITATRIQIEAEYNAVTAAAQAAAANIQGAFADFFMDFDKGIKGMAQGFIRALQQMVANLAASQLMSLIGSGLAGSSNTFLASIGKGLTVPGRASGGPVTAGAPYMVGERGPELFVPGMSGNIVPGGGMLNVNYAPTINIESRTDRAAVRQDMIAITQEGQRQLVESLRDRRTRGVGL